MTRDRNFLVDSLKSRGMPQIIVCCGAGHAYKYVCPLPPPSPSTQKYMAMPFTTIDRFASFLGRILAEVAVSGSTSYDIDGFRFERDAIQNEKHPRAFWRGDMTTARLWRRFRKQNTLHHDRSFYDQIFSCFFEKLWDLYLCSAQVQSFTVDYFSNVV